ncbi:NAD(P)/FAD-dependent oxidoreductase [Photobacterium angustum]|uniref:NAD(P)/FAD-dependent oxidoreductase n=1 Tax=Photobacterium angustum TaxID=661 RepID=UPI0005DADB5A|nr:FAD-dependent oxidoreductase [Photobacterium angustum]KJG17735.1 FAD-dependent oxidoreductase [Photobacterium angustum]KJG24941.1 FAD-dependent oxidoreductase [Photobacterium angustum]KJG32931.1 FAD-dependent oxidoreductase [Photobacterium angustum]PSW97549.1 FAD-dependent oxidoreductase [Photobacterium angustum]PSX00256.1 FAD-dependent oxidoreductase [Photobacterium angustum]
MKIAIIGSGISGLTSAWYLYQDHEVTVYEANSYVGGHTATVDVTVDSGDYAIDTGFIVFNDRTYPNFENLLEQLEITGKPSEMSFSVHNERTGLEYNGHTISSLFAQKRNLLNPAFYRFLYEITQFNKLAKQVVGDSELMDQTLGDFLIQHKFSDYFAENYILPMGAAIWSSTLSDMRRFPLAFFLRFFLNHGLLDITNRPQWRVIPGGSREYVRKMMSYIGDCIQLNSPVSSVKRSKGKVIVTVDSKQEEFDQVIFACHSDQALTMLSDATSEENYVLSDIHYQENEVVLHTDTSLLPKRKAAWASWNYSLPKSSDDRERNLASLTYNMNILQGILAPETFCVTLNQTESIDKDKILRKFVYSHPVFNTKSIAAQQKRHLINGQNQTWFCGAYWYNGFHEDGVRSALDVVEAIKMQSLTQSEAEDHTAQSLNVSLEPSYNSVIRSY